MEIEYSVPSADAPVLYLGALCKRAHKHEGLIRSLRYKNSRDCVECVRLRNAATPGRAGRKTPQAQRRQTLKRRGISAERYENLLQLQDGLCAICFRPERKPGHNLSVDHCHDTGKIRGLLCSACNRGIGSLGDSLERVRAAVAYLEMHSAPSGSTLVRRAATC